jgi:alkaline phosphatase D
VFLHGVASGDPTDHGVILWTRISVSTSQAVTVRWRIAEDRQMTRLVANGRTRTDASDDFTVKVDAGGLPSGRTLYYQFSAADEDSGIGQTRTLPTDCPDMVKLAVVSCSNYPAGFFNVYRDIARRTDLDAVVHLGDYIYEYGMNGYGTEHAEALGRVPLPVTELSSLQDYRQRHAQYKTDPDSQAMLASLPLIAVWDDHELANDSWHEGAQGHSKDEGRWAARRDAAVQAYFEWMPIRGRPNGRKSRIFREFRFGDLASLIMLDTRVYGRDRQPDAGENVTADSVAAALHDPARRMLGKSQERWLRKRLKRAANTTWQILGQQVLMSRMISPNPDPLVDIDAPSVVSKEYLQAIVERSRHNPPSVLDTWDGYPYAREDLYADLKKYAVNPVILSGDLHTMLAADLIPEHSDDPVAVEFMTGAVSSPVMSEVLPERAPNSVRDGTLQQNPWVRYLDIAHRGWLCLTLTGEQCSGEWYLIDSVQRRDHESWLDRRLTVHAGEIDKGLQG